MIEPDDLHLDDKKKITANYLIDNKELKRASKRYEILASNSNQGVKLK